MASNVECENYHKNLERCPCTSEDCERKGTCCECIAAHLGRGSFPACVKAALK